MLNFEGNTAIFLCYAYVRIESILNKINQDNYFRKICYSDININTLEEKNLLIHIFQFDVVITSFHEEFMPHLLCEYLYRLSEKFNSFFHKCNIRNNILSKSRIYICTLTKTILKKGMNILGLKILKRM